MNSVYAVLIQSYPQELVEALLAAYDTIEKNYRLRRWKASELDGGHFVEAARRMLDQEFGGQYVPIGKSLPPFSDQVLRQYESKTGPEGLRILIPRALWSLYAVRNKRGVAHLSLVSSNEMDASLILSEAKWVLAEFVREKSGLSPEETAVLIHNIVQRDLPITWDAAGTTRILARMRAREQILVLLLQESPQTAAALQSAVEYTNSARFRKILQALHSERLIEFTQDGFCHLSPTGEIEAERELLKAGTVR